MGGCGHGMSVLRHAGFSDVMSSREVTKSCVSNAEYIDAKKPGATSSSALMNTSVSARASLAPTFWA